MGAGNGGSEEAPLFYKVSSAVFFGVSSILVVFVNKILLTNYGFPSFLFVGIGQMFATLLIIDVAAAIGLISYPRLDRSIPRKIFPLPLIYVFNLVSGLGGTQRISLPMFTVLRRFSILMTMILEYFILGVRAPFAVKVSVGLMIVGSFIAAIYDLSFDAYGYTLIMVNNVFTAANGVFVKQKLEAKDLGKYGLMYYNCFFMLLPATLFAVFSDDYPRVIEFVASDKLTPGVIVCFLLSCVCGFILNYSQVLCTHYNSALTTTCVGPIKNLIVTYAGMISSGDYVFEWTNFIGINVSTMGSIIYTYVTFRRKPAPQTPSRERLIQVDARPHEKKPLI